MRLVESAHYSDAALSVYMKIKALGQRPEGCTAGVATLASYLGLSPSTVERALAQLRSPAAPDGIVELPENRRRSLPGGRGTTALRRVRPMTASERFIWLPVHASESLPPRLLRAYAVISYAVIQWIPLSEGDLAGYLRHHTGPRAGQPITVDAAGRVIDRLAASGWLTVERRAGDQGRHLFLVHNSSSGPATSPTPPSPPSLDDGSAPDPDAGSLATKEDPTTDRPDDARELVPPAVGELTVVGATAASADRPQAAVRAEHVALRAGHKIPSPPNRTDTTRPAAPANRRPQLTFSPRIDAVLDPVRILLGGVNRYVLRRIGHEIGHQLDNGTNIDRLRARLTSRLAGTFIDEIRDPGRWLLGVALPRWGCANPDCETGVLWSTGEPCRACQEFRADRRCGRTGTGAPAAELHCCPVCERPLRPGQSGECAQCSQCPTAPPPEPWAAQPCPGRHGAHCGRPAPSGLCWRCRMEELAEQEPVPAASEAGPPPILPLMTSAGTRPWASTG
ncbi:hypothetical protein ACFXPW_12885 [Streptomyces goshikiensis]|uniref:hypothetical protein n=1 Tax=Streptomyces goshikiensis TaxID=1942 RepID=UPI0036997E7E